MSSLPNAVEVNDTWPNLPSEILIDILCRLRLRSIISCKSVCKSWFEVVETSEFADLHFSKIVPQVIVCRNQAAGSVLFSIFDPCFLPCASFDRGSIVSSLFGNTTMEGSVNGLLLLRHGRADASSPSLSVCNPTTREYVDLPNIRVSDYSFVVAGFGVSKTTNEYKIVTVFHTMSSLVLSIPQWECRVYTLGTRSWRSVPHDLSVVYQSDSNNTFLNDNLHWMVLDINEPPLVSCFDLGTEMFKTISTPRSPQIKRRDVGELGGRLCLVDSTYTGTEIWIMQEYGVAESWTRQIVVRPDCPTKVLRDDNMMVLSRGDSDFNISYYSENTKAISNVDMSVELLWSCLRLQARRHLSSFVSLKRFPMENVAKF